MPKYNNPVNLPETLPVADVDATAEIREQSADLAAKLWPDSDKKSLRNSEDTFILNEKGILTKTSLSDYFAISSHAMSGRLYARDNNNNLRQIQLEFKDGEYFAALSKPVHYIEEHRPTWWKYILHAIFNAFSEEFEAYEQRWKFNEACRTLAENAENNITIQPLEAAQAEAENQQPVAQEDGLVQPEYQQPEGQPNEVQQPAIQNPEVVQPGFAVHTPAILARMQQRLTYSLAKLDLPKSFTVKGEDLGVLVAMSQGTSDLYYKQGHKKRDPKDKKKTKAENEIKAAENVAEKPEAEEQKEPTLIKNDPDKNYKTLVGVHFVQSETLNKPYDNFITAGTVHVRRALRAADGGDYTSLARILAHGLVQNNKILLEQRKLTDTYTGYATLGAKAVAFIEKTPALKEAVLKELNGDTKQFDIAKAAKNISDFRVSVMSGFEDMVRNYGIIVDNKYVIDGEHKEVAKVCLLSQIEMNMNLNKFNSEQLTKYADPKTIEKAVETIEQTNTVGYFLADSKRDEKLRNPRAMMKVADRAIKENDRKMQQEMQKKQLQNSKDQQIEQGSAQNGMEQVIS